MKSPRAVHRRNKRKGKTAIITASPYKFELEEEELTEKDKEEERIEKLKEKAALKKPKELFSKSKEKQACLNKTKLEEGKAARKERKGFP